jgi:hypothetical protein
MRCRAPQNSFETTGIITGRSTPIMGFSSARHCVLQKERRLVRAPKCKWGKAVACQILLRCPLERIQA